MNNNTSIPEKQIQMLKAIWAAKEVITVFDYALTHNVDKSYATKIAEHLGKIGALEISFDPIDGYGNKMIWPNLQTERIMNNSNILNPEKKISIKNITDSIVIAGNNSVSQSDLSNKYAPDSHINLDPPTKKWQKRTFIAGIATPTILFFIQHFF